MDNKRFKAWLVENGIKQSEVAEVLGITPQLCNAKVNGKQPFTLAQVKKLCQQYKISANFFI